MTRTKLDERTGATTTAPSLRVRPSDPDDLDEVGRITHAAYSNDYEISEGYGHQLLHPEERLAEFEIWVAEDPVTSEILGTVSILRPGVEHEGRLRQGELYFRLLAVSPNARRRGVGSALTNVTFELARARELHTVALNSGEHMLGAHALYRALGFERDLERDVRISDGGRAITVYTFTKPVEGSTTATGQETTA